MDIGKISNVEAPIKTEWRNNVNQPDAPSIQKEETFGAQLNRISGSAPEGKNLYEKKGELSKEAYLKMLMEQLKFQDPFNPVKNDQFSQQMTSLSQLEQQVNTNKNLEKLVQQQNNTQLGALQLVGKNISGDRAAIYHDKEKVSSLQFKLPQDALEVRLEVYNQANEKIRTIPLGSQQQGDVKSKWDGMSDNGQPVDSGRYNYKIFAKGMDGKDMPISTKVDGRVTGVTTSQGTVFLLVGDQRVGLSDIETIKEGSSDEKSLDKKGTGINIEPTSMSQGQVLLPGGKIDVEDKNAKEPEVSVSRDAAKSLTGERGMNDLMPLLMR